LEEVNTKDRQKSEKNKKKIRAADHQDTQGLPAWKGSRGIKSQTN